MSTERRYRAVAIDDHEEILALYEAMLADSSIELVATATSGEAGIRLVREHEPDLVLLDLGMPDMDGLEVLQRLRGGVRRPRVAVVSGFSRERMERDTERLGAEVFIEKGMPPRELVQRLERLAELGPVTRELI